jgi:hypothetical protein
MVAYFSAHQINPSLSYYAYMANDEHVEILARGVTGWHAWRSKNRRVSPDLSRVEFVDADLQGVDLHSVNFSDTNLSATNLYLADLSGAKLYGANLTRADLNMAVLLDAELAAALFGRTKLAALDLRRAKGLEAARHQGPSSIGIDTVFASDGKIPEPFLKGVGVPDTFIAFIRSLAANPIKFYSCFISYSTKDEVFANRLYDELQARVRCWFAPQDIQGGKKIHEQIDEAIQAHDRLLIILSEHSMKSEWVKTEITKARRREVKENRRVLFPIRLVSFQALQAWECFDADLGKDSAKEIRQFYVPDFSRWREGREEYLREVDRLLRDLRASRA